MPEQSQHGETLNNTKNRCSKFNLFWHFKSLLFDQKFKIEGEIENYLPEVFPQHCLDF